MEALDLSEENVKVRLRRARALLGREIYARSGTSRSTAFAFMGGRCDNVVRTVFKRLAQVQRNPATRAC